MALLLRGGLLITMNAERAVLTADILVEGTASRLWLPICLRRIRPVCRWPWKTWWI